MFLTAPRGMRSADIGLERRAMLETVSTVQPLRQWAANLKVRPETAYLPDFDPAEAGAEARVLIVAEAPGPKTNPLNNGSGFISVDNDDPSAEDLWRLRNEAGLHYGVLLWNIVPWYLGTAAVKPTRDDLERGAAALRGLLEELPDLQVVLLTGLPAQTGWDKHLSGYRTGDITVIRTWHFSGLALKQPGKRAELLASLRKAKDLIGQPDPPPSHPTT